ncbi:MAG: helicase [Thermoleophilia bacterium]|nr:helicase [Thermoleophilia bacterium]
MTEPLAPGLRDELMTEELRSLVSQLSDERVVTSRLSEAEAVERIGRHLLQAARRLRAPAKASDIDAMAQVANRAVLTLGDDFAGDQLVTPVGLLTGIVPAQVGAETPKLPPAPSIPLATTELLVNGDGQPTLGQLLLQEIRCADNVDLICAFVGWTGVSQLLDELRALVERGGSIRVVTSTYLGATSGKALDELVKIGASVCVRYDGNATKLHAKSWLFHRPGGLDTAYIGSSNLSQAALHDGIEWNVRLARADAPAVFIRMQGTFDSYWNDASYEPYSLVDRKRLDDELARAKGSDQQRHSARSQREIEQLNRQLADAYAELALRPRPHQQHVLDQLELRRRTFDEHRHLVVAATGTGKTVMAALDYARLCSEGEPRPKLLFVAHREQILVQARSTFRQVLQDPAFGEILGGSEGAARVGRHVFAMIQTISSPSRLEAIERDAYDVVYIDEAHHGTADSWRRLIEHLRPQEIVGLTATPERVDGVNVADLFGGEYTTELRLWEAVDDQLLAPFQYIGVDDGTDLRQLSWRGGDYAVGELSELYTSHHGRVKAVVQAIHQWIEKPAEMRALGFCVTKQHAQFMAEQFERHGFNAAYLTGDDPQHAREVVLAQLTAGKLQVVFSVDVLGEGVDVPDVDTLLLLRPTQSSVLFAQQLGRGLRLAPGKRCCTVLDLIGQHHAKYRVDQRYRALVDTSRGSVREQAEQGFPFLPAGSSITLDHVARDRVLAQLKQLATRPGAVAMRKDLASIGNATMAEFLERTERTTSQLYRPSGMSWTKLQRESGIAEAPKTSPDPAEVAEETDLLKRIGHLQHVMDPYRVNTWGTWLRGPFAPDPREMTTTQQRSAVQLMHLLLRQPSSLAEGFSELWRHEAPRREIAELLEIRGRELDAEPRPLLDLPDVPLQVHARYARPEVFAALGISEVAKMKEHREGVYYSHDLRTQLMFVTLHKDNQRYAPSVQYRDHAISRDLFHWESPNSWRRDSPAMRRCIGSGDDGSLHRLLFVRESPQGSISSRFRFFGHVDLAGQLEGDRPVALTWRLRHSLPEALFERVRLVAAG